jgi:hypothetical protein
VKTVCTNHNNKIDDAIESLRALAFTDASTRNKSQSFDSTFIDNCADVPGQSTAPCKLLVMLPLISSFSH